MLRSAADYLRDRGFGVAVISAREVRTFGNDEPNFEFVLKFTGTKPAAAFVEAEGIAFEPESKEPS